MTNPVWSIRSARRFATLMDSQFSIAGIKFGVDSLVSLVPGLGDLFGLILSLYLLIVAIKLKLPLGALFKMGLNLLIDASVGSVPILGDLFDLAFKANQRNLRILEKYAS